MDPMTQSAQISSSQGLAEGHNSAAKESKMSDSFLSSSPVSLIQSPQDKRVFMGSDKSCEGVATSLRFPSQPGSFTPGNYGSEAGPPDGQPDSPIKTSPVSERIKALEALAAKKKEPDFRSDYSHYRDRHHEKSPTDTTKSPTEKVAPTVPKRGGSADLESPESPFEVLGDVRQVNDFEETEVWMKAHLPPVPDFDAVDLMKGTPASDNVTSKEEKEAEMVIPDAPAAFAGVPDAFVDTPAEAPKLKDELSDAKKHACAKEDSEFDLSFLPTAYMWDQQEKSGVQAPLNRNSDLPPSPAPPVGFDSPPAPVSPPVDGDSKQTVSDDKKLGELDPPEASEADSSGESDDTVIEDAIATSVGQSTDPAVSNDPTTTSASADHNVSTEEKVPLRTERKLMQVPTINVIETDEPNYSDEEMEMECEAEEDEDYEVVKDPVPEASNVDEPEDGKNEATKTRPLETEFMEGYSPPSSPVGSDAEYSPKHNILETLPETVRQELESKTQEVPNKTDSKDLASHFSQPILEKSEDLSNNNKDEPYSFKGTNDQVDFEDDDEWSNEAKEILVKPCKTANFKEQTHDQSKDDEKAKEAVTKATPLSKTSFMQDDIYDRESFDYDYDASSPFDAIDYKGLNSAEGFVETLNESTVQSQSFSSVNEETALINEANSSQRDYPQDPYSCFQHETQSSINDQDFIKKIETVTDNMADKSLPVHETQQNTKAGHDGPQTAIDLESIDHDSSAYEPTDSFVDFMRECLKSRQDEEPDDAHEDVSSGTFPPTMVMDLEQEQLTISALKELGSSREDDDDEEEEVAGSRHAKIPDQDEAQSNTASVQQSSFEPVSNPPCSQSNPVSDKFSKEVEAIDEWVAEAYHLAEHVLTAILTHLSVKDLIHWRDPKKSGLAFGLSMLLLLSLAAFSVISVVSYLLLALLCVTITFRIYKSVVQAVQKSSDGHPFKALIDKDVSIPPETFRKHVDCSLTHINKVLKQMSRLFLVEDLVDSLKLAVVMWLFTYVGAVFNGITILILADILLFAVPPIYEKNKTQIDQYIDLVRTQVNTTIAKLQEKLPGAVKRSKTE